jgi:ABC-type sugar transport system substrate-binding protein
MTDEKQADEKQAMTDWIRAHPQRVIWALLALALPYLLLCYAVTALIAGQIAGGGCAACG